MSAWLWYVPVLVLALFIHSAQAQVSIGQTQVAIANADGLILGWESSNPASDAEFLLVESEVSATSPAWFFATDYAFRLRVLDMDGQPQDLMDAGGQIVSYVEESVHVDFAEFQGLPFPLTMKVHRTHKLRLAGATPQGALLSAEVVILENGSFQGSASSIPRPIQWMSGRLSFGGIFASISGFKDVHVTPGTQPVKLTMTFAAGHLALESNPATKFGDGPELSLQLESNGDATVMGGALPGPDSALGTFTAGNVAYDLDAVFLGPSGAVGNVLVHLPAGAGVSDSTTKLRLEGEVLFAAAPLASNLRPGSLQMDVALQYCDESLPVWIGVDQVAWDPPGPIRFRATGQTRFVREDTEKQFEDLGGIPGIPGDWRRRSNDLLYRHLHVAAGVWVVLDTVADGTGRTSFDGTFTAGQFRTHFPFDLVMAWSAGGDFMLRLGIVDALHSALSGVSGVAVGYMRKCADADMACDANVGAGEAVFAPALGRVQSSRDGGLFATGSVPQVQSPSWGAVKSEDGVVSAVHMTSGYTMASLLVPGVFGWFGSETDALADSRGAMLLFRGLTEPDVSAPGAGRVEEVGSEKYLEGLASYAGLNLVQPEGGNATAVSILGGQKTTEYALSDASKLYLRRGGVSGVHVARAGSLPSVSQLYGYALGFTQFGMSFLDSQVEKSVTRGALSLPYPAGFSLTFEELKFKCNGALGVAKLPENPPPLKLEYWNAQIEPLAVGFETPTGCDPTKGFLTLDVEVHASHIAQPMHGRLGFKPNGRLVAPSDHVPGVSGRLTMPGVIQVRGPGQEHYNLVVRSDAFFNSFDHAQSSSEPFGFLTFSGSLDLPFFEDLQVQVQTSALKGDQASPLYLTAPWREGQVTYATSPAFDVNNIGFPAPQGVSLAAFRAGGASGAYLPRARRKWLNLVQFDYPVAWSTATRSFRSKTPSTANLLVLAAEHQVRFMGAESLDLTFGAEFSGLPKINLASLGYNLVDDKTGVSAAFAKAVSQAALDKLGSGLAAVQRLVGADGTKLFKPALEQALSPSMSALAAQLKAIPAATDYKSQVQGLLMAEYPSAASEGIQGMVLPGGAFASDVAAALGKGANALEVIESLASKGSGFVQVVALAKELLKMFSPGANTAAIDAMLPSVMAALEGVGQTASELKQAVAKASQALGVGGDFAAELKQVMQAGAPALQVAVGKATLEVQQALLKPGNPGVTALQEMSVDDVKSLLLDRMMDHVAGTAVAGALQTVARQRLYDLNASMRVTVDDTFQQVNLLLRAAVQQVVGQADQQFSAMLGDLPNLGTARVDGYAHINGDSLSELRLDAALSLPVPEPMEINGFFRFRELTSSSPGGCSWQPGESAAEVTFGAKKVPLKFQPIPKVMGDFDMKFAFRKQPSFAPAGLAGGARLYFDANTGLLGFRAPEVQAMASFGLHENYVAGGFSGTLMTGTSSVDAQAGFFLGRTCSAVPIKLFDPYAGEFLPSLETAGFTGIYAAGSAYTKFADFGCVFNAGAGVALRSYLTPSGAYGALSGKASGELLCVVSATGSLSLAGGVQNQQPWLEGVAAMSAKVGICPFCKKIGKQVGIHYKNGKFGGKL